MAGHRSLSLSSSSVGPGLFLGCRSDVCLDFTTTEKNPKNTNTYHDGEHLLVDRSSCASLSSQGNTPAIRAKPNNNTASSLITMVENTNPAEKLGRTVINGIITAVPICLTFFDNVHKLYKKLPTDYLHLLIGAVLCFFGGFYPTVFAAL